MTKKAAGLRKMYLEEQAQQLEDGDDSKAAEIRK
jgi:hypothetical protein